MIRFYQIPQNYQDDLAQFSQALDEFKRGELDPLRFKAHRVGFGVYEQRTPDTYMIRIRCAGGAVTPGQLLRVAELSSRYGADHIHVTTRHELQMHDVSFENILAVVSALPEVGLATKGGGGNTIRNITASPGSGIDADEVFDVAPYAMALTTRMIEESDSFNLPRKMKIAFSNSNADTASASLMDLGFIAVLRNGDRGFRVFAAGGMGAKPRPGKLLHEFIPVNRVYHVTKAIKRMFDAHGNRRNKHNARLRFLWDKLGEDRFRELYLEELNRVEAEYPPPLMRPGLENEGTPPDSPPQELQDNGMNSGGFEQWKTRYVRTQLQAGLATIKVPLKLGDLRNEHAESLARLLIPFGENVLRFSREQNIHVRNIPEKYLETIFNGLANLDTHSFHPPLIGNMIACTGAATCKLGICLPRGLTGAIQQRLLESDLDLDALGEFRLNISGCPNSCGQHHAADFGLFGKVNRKAGSMIPAYNIMGGARVSGEGSRLAEKMNDISARDVPDLLHDVIADWLANKERHGEFSTYLEAGGRESITGLANRYNQRVPAPDQNGDYYTDWGSNEPFSLVNRGMGECSAGLFDMIDVDRKMAKEQLAMLQTSEVPGEISAAAQIAMRATVRMLLITRGLEPKTDEEIYKHFQQHFIEAGLISAEYIPLLVLGKQGRFDELARLDDSIAKLLDDVILLYREMDDSLRFPVEIEEKSVA